MRLTSYILILMWFAVSAWVYFSGHLEWISAAAAPGLIAVGFLSLSVEDAPDFAKIFEAGLLDQDGNTNVVSNTGAAKKLKRENGTRIGVLVTVLLVATCQACFGSILVEYLIGMNE